MTTMEKVSELHVYGRHYIIAKDSNGYWAINEKHLEGGKLMKKLNGLQGHLSTFVDGCIASATQEALIEKLMDEGMELHAAFRKAWEILGW